MLEDGRSPDHGLRRASRCGARGRQPLSKLRAGPSRRRALASAQLDQTLVGDWLLASGAAAELALILRAALDQQSMTQSKSVCATCTPVEDGDLARRLEAAAKRQGEEGWRPMLVLEIARSGDSELINSACTLLKLITHDQPLCHGILVLNDLSCDEIGQELRYPMRDLMRELLDTGAPIKLPNSRLDLSSATFASTTRMSEEAKAAFNVDLVSRTVDFASGAHRKAAAELAARRGLLNWLFGSRM
eukprot:scaffold1200_cov236-Isochrysis_galbana.AAC.2